MDTQRDEIKLLGPSTINDRFDVYRFFNGLSVEDKDGLDNRYTRIPLVKTFLLDAIFKITGSS